MALKVVLNPLTAKFDLVDVYSPLLTRTATGPVSAHRVVKSLANDRVTYCDSNTAGDRPLVLGISLQAASNGGTLLVQESGEIVEPSWSWTPGGVLYCGAAGALTQTFDASWSWARIVGVAIDATTVFVRLDMPIVQI